MNSAEIRKAFLDYFHGEGHEIVPSSSLIPHNDPTLLFTNAGMVQFKDVFLGLETRQCRRAVSSQRCVRAGGKHNDLENVGYTARHHTFFEMLGNFSFGDYFKREAITFAWTFLTVNLRIPTEKLWVTVFKDDQEAADIWLNEIGIDPARFSRLGEKDNFWAMGDTGPCGPCSEIFYDHGESIPGGPPGSPDDDGDRYIEIWNLVFMQFNRSADGQMSRLPKPSVDTGMGLERIAAIMQGVHSNYDIDLFQALLRAAAEIVGTKDYQHASLKVIADHIRSCAFLITDGVLPANEGRGYVLRRIIRRALRHGHRLGVSGPFFYRLVATLARLMGEAYPELLEAQARVEETLQAEEEQFSRTLANGMDILEQAIAALQGREIPGETVFQLYDTYGFPVDLTADIARERELTLDLAGFDAAMARQKARARSASRFESTQMLNLEVQGETRFVGYDRLGAEAVVLGLYRDGQMVNGLTTGETGTIVLDNTAFYAESGGQVGDVGELQGLDTRFVVTDTRKQQGLFLHHGQVREGQIRTGDRIAALVNQDTRCATMLNHSATHLMHAALRQVLGEHVTQKGSLVNPEYLRFDFSHNKALTSEELDQIEALVNAEIQANTEVRKQVMPLEKAREMGAMALFDEKYGDQVRVVGMGSKPEPGGREFSIELCGGTHVDRTGAIGVFKIIQESGIAAGVRRIEALTGMGALRHIKQSEEKLKVIAALVKTGSDHLVDKIQQLAASNRNLEKEVMQLKARLASTAGADLAGSAESVKGIKVLAVAVPGLDSKALRETTDQLKNKLGSAVVVLAAVDGDKVSLVAGVTRDLLDRIKAGDLVNMVAQQVGGKGGGRPDMAMAGGTDPAGLDAALASVKPYIERVL
ncbi:MAG: alanine--tRNA ligase [Pseudomonadales bacterium]|nr:alanine--tRNA ligase [Pseudomonadales bacterium]